MKKLRNKRVLITGASSGIGQAIAVAYAEAGAYVAFSYFKNEKGAQETLEKLKYAGVEGKAFMANLLDSASVYQLIKDAIQYHGYLDILVNNAGIISRHTNFTDIPIESFDAIQQVNLRVPFILTQEMAEHLKSRKSSGSIINISSMSAEITTPGLAHYECSKAALNALTRGAASDLAPYNIRVNAIAPGLVATDINKEQRENDPEAWIRRSSKIPLGRAGLPSDIAGLAVFLASEEAAWMTGTVIPIDGGIGIASPFAKTHYHSP